MGINCTCDICNSNIPMTEIDTTKTDIQINSIESSFKVEFACSVCKSAILNFIDTLKTNRIYENPIIREDVFNVYKNTRGGQGSKISAIKRLREITGIGLKQSKDMVEEWEAKMDWKMKASINY